MSCVCYDPITFGHQDRQCPGSLRFGLDDLDCYLRSQRDAEQGNQWYIEEAVKRRELGIVTEPDPWPLSDPWPQPRRSLTSRIRRGFLRVFHSTLA